MLTCFANVTGASIFRCNDVTTVELRLRPHADDDTEEACFFVRIEDLTDLMKMLGLVYFESLVGEIVRVRLAGEGSVLGLAGADDGLWFVVDGLEDGGKQQPQ